MIRTITAASFALLASGSFGQVVISQVYTGGGVSAAAYRNDYIELLNTSSTDYDLTGHSVQYGNQNTTTIGQNSNWRFSFPANTIIPAKHYLLIKCSTTSNVTGGLPAVVPGYDFDAGEGQLDLSPTGGKLALCNTTTAINQGSNTNPLPLPDSRILDLVGWGNSNIAEGGSAIYVGPSTMPTTEVLCRKNLGQQDTNNNVNDFQRVLTASQTPRNLTSTPVPVTVSTFEVE